ncbi:MAG: pyruvate formate-lyase-activating protein [Lachnospiraceae bacterium]|nr:pyruvate formate-lyase-activating protein [Lachnospiraceae bacterium]
MTKGYVNSVESFGSVDGPGVRYIFFMQGCKMRCRYCHNPETWSLRGGEEMTPEEALDKAKRYKSYWGKKGGITVSGGEALLQIDFVTELFKLAHEHGIHTALDTAGNPFTTEEPFYSEFEALMKVTDLVILDIKEMDAASHKALTGFTNDNILQMARWCSDHGVHMWIRKVLVPGITDSEDELVALRDFVASLGTVDRFEVLPYHTLGLSKWKKLGIPYTLEGVKPPTKEEITHAEEVLGTAGYTGS